MDNLISFGELDSDALDKTYEWLHDKEIMRLTMAHCFSREEQKKWYESLRYKEDYWIKIVKFREKSIGVVGIKNINIKQGEGEYFCYIGEKEMWGKGIGTIMLSYAIKHAKKMRLRYVFANVANYNSRSRRLFEKNGFTVVDYSDDCYLLQLKL